MGHRKVTMLDDIQDDEYLVVALGDDDDMFIGLRHNHIQNTWEWDELFERAPSLSVFDTYEEAEKACNEEYQNIINSKWEYEKGTIMKVSDVKNLVRMMEL